MKILHLTLGFYPAVSWGGPLKIVHQNGRELVKRGHEVTVFCSNLLNKKQKIQPGTFEKKIDGMRVVYFDAWNLPWWPGTLGPIWLPGLPGALDREISQYDVIHINGFRSPMMLVAAQAARKHKIPFVTQPHGTIPVVVNSLWIKRLYDHWLGNQETKGISALIALQGSERDQAISHGIPSELIRIIPNGITRLEPNEMPIKGAFRKSYGISTDCAVILFLARINKKKGTDMLIHAFAQMKNTETLLVIAGPDDGQLAEVQSLVEHYGLQNRVVFVGLLSGTDIMSAYQDSDLFVLPCRTDTFPTTIMEACLANTPMVVTDRCEIADLIKDRVAEVVPFEPKAFADALDRLLDDPNLYDRYRANCSLMIEDTFSIQAVVDRLEELYRTVTAERTTLL